jgi:hypothetical protein
MNMTIAEWYKKMSETMTAEGRGQGYMSKIGK